MKEESDFSLIKIILIGFWLFFILFISFSFLIIAKAESFSFDSLVVGYAPNNNNSTLSYDLLLVPNYVHIANGDLGYINNVLSIGNSSTSYGFVSGHSYGITFDFDLYTLPYSNIITGNGIISSSNIWNNGRNFYFSVGNSGSWTNATFDSVISCTERFNDSHNRVTVSCDYTLDVTRTFDSFRWEFYDSHSSVSSSNESYLGMIVGVNSAIVGIYDLTDGESPPSGDDSSGVDLSYIESELSNINSSLSGSSYIIGSSSGSFNTELGEYYSKRGSLDTLKPSTSDFDTIYSYNFNHNASDFIWALFTRFLNVSPYLFTILMVLLTLGIVRQIFNR